MTAPESVTITLPTGALGGWGVLAKHLRLGTDASGLQTLSRLADQIEAQLPKPKPEEPKGWLAVVEAKDGRRWYREQEGDCEHPWRAVRGRYGVALYNNWDEIPFVTVLSEGVPS